VTASLNNHKSNLENKPQLERILKVCGVIMFFKSMDGRIILRWIFRKWEGLVGTGWSWLRIGTGGGHL
jgi:hypothetical protein